MVCIGERQPSDKCMHSTALALALLGMPQFHIAASILAHVHVYVPTVYM